MDKCSVKDCNGGLHSGGLCSRHYNRLRTTGTTNDGPRARGTLADRLWKYIDRRSYDECWPWTSKSKIKGYGVIKLDGTSKKALAHRAVWLLTKGVIPDSVEWHGTVVRHTCNNRLCCNPEHLVLGSQADNVADMWENKKSPRGNARLTEEQVAEIRKDKRSSRELAPLYGVHHGHIRSIRRGRSW